MARLSKKRYLLGITPLVLSALFALGGASISLASSHMDAPLITLDDPANTTDVYAFRSRGEDGTEYLTTALAVYPFEEPGIGPNNFRFDDNVRYDIHIALDGDVENGRRTISYRFRFETEFNDDETILQAFLGPIENVFDENQNLRQTFEVARVKDDDKEKLNEEECRVPPNNQGLVTRFYNQDNNGQNPAG